MANSVWVRLSQMKDASELMELDHLVWQRNNTPSVVQWNNREEFLRKCPPGSQLVAGMDDKICGYLGFDHPTPLESNKHVLEINIAVHPGCQRMGIGQKLMEAVKELAAARGVRKLSLRVLSSNPDAVAFYRKCGFQEQGRLVEEFYLDGQYVDDILMWSPVEQS
ncbi:MULTISPECIES: GNAT family N-acetyltransferase [Paenibacillus]|uniref:N-acetyltransferase n=1 Tax=Paenibacillus apis TaxID=1792174 RepID=A0A920CK16_9BACL|nr:MULTISPECIES: N-acetyltransferase [Paenibacillus]GIO42100.1 N-acetyltransferase [Paenibacillus apis]